MCSMVLSDVIPFSQKEFRFTNGDQLSRGNYLIVLSNPDLYSGVLELFISLKNNQGYHVEVISFGGSNEDVQIGLNGSSADDLKTYIESYYDTHPLLEYVLLVGDVNQNSNNYNIPTYTIPSYNEAELDQTDYPYTFFEFDDVLSPKFFIGRWSIGSSSDLDNIIYRNMNYSTLQYLNDTSYLDNALVVAGNYSGEGISPDVWPVTPVWTSKWLQEELFHYGYEEVDSAFFHKHNYLFATDPEDIVDAWNDGVGVVNYRGWGDARGWHKPQFRLNEIESYLNPSLALPVVFSFVCNTGDFGNEANIFCFGEKLITAGTPSAPKGAVAMIGPSDLDTDTRFNNVLCGALWDEMLEDRIHEMAPALHMGKQAVASEFEDLYIAGTNIGEFYHHVYGVIGDPSLSVWLKDPGSLSLSGLGEDESISNPFLNLTVSDSESGDFMSDVIGVVISDCWFNPAAPDLCRDGNIIGRGISNQDGNLDIDFTDMVEIDMVEIGDTLDLYLNRGQYHQEHISFVYTSDSGGNFSSSEYLVPEEVGHGYTYEIIDYNWIDISSSGVNLNLTDDSTTPIIKSYIGEDGYYYNSKPTCESVNGEGSCSSVQYGENDFTFTYFDDEFSVNDMIACSNGWASMSACLDGNLDDNRDCDPINYFYNNSITFPIGPYGMLAPFYDDLDDNGGTEELNVYSELVDGGTKLIIQWDEIANGQVDEYCDPNSDNDPEECKKETFQLILFRGDIVGDINQDFVLDILDIVYIVYSIFQDIIDPPTPYQEELADIDGDGSVNVLDIIMLIDDITAPNHSNSYSYDNKKVDIIFQYKEIYNVDDHGATVGIESISKNQGVQYLFNTTYDENALELQNSLAIRFYKTQ